MIYKTFYGKHIDLNRLIAVSSVYLLRDRGCLPFSVGFDMTFQLMDNPIVYHREVRWEECGDEYGSLKLIDGRSMAYPTWEDITWEDINEKYIMAVLNLQNEVDILIAAWKKFKEGKQ